MSTVIYHLNRNISNAELDVKRHEMELKKAKEILSKLEKSKQGELSKLSKYDKLWKDKHWSQHEKWYSIKFIYYLKKDLLSEYFLEGSMSKNGDFLNHLCHILTETQYSNIDEVNFDKQVISYSWDVEDPYSYGNYVGLEEISFEDVIKKLNKEDDDND